MHHGLSRRPQEPVRPSLQASDHNLNSGTYCTSLVLSGTKTVNLNPGVYIFNKASLISERPLP